MRLTAIELKARTLLPTGKMPVLQKVNLLGSWAGELTPEKLFDNGTKCDIRGNSQTSWKKLFYLGVGQAHFFCGISRRKRTQGIRLASLGLIQARVRVQEF
ncbi:MAG: hypothetical protein EAZ09_01430 [Oscillatoriales cyanobacterium]|nr:MAG: hypothetical protein EAZ18_22460 [Oscillatoriales cyanobacterium]TAH25929.1 MAG: hypothetical protein EAZ09_01430 [Oscillatoriales cyanobacterium]